MGGSHRSSNRVWRPCRSRLRERQPIGRGGSGAADARSHHLHARGRFTHLEDSEDAHETDDTEYREDAEGRTLLLAAAGVQVSATGAEAHLDIEWKHGDEIDPVHHADQEGGLGRARDEAQDELDGKACHGYNLAYAPGLLP